MYTRNPGEIDFGSSSLGSQLYTDCTTSTSFTYWEELTFKIAFELS